MTLKESLINYLHNSPLLYDKPPIDVSTMSIDELLEFADAIVDEEANDISSHSYEIIEIDSYATAKKYEHYAPTWCIFQSEDVFYEETYKSTCHFIFCKRDDADKYTKVAFGAEYPYDNYGVSFFAVLLTEGNRLISVTSRRNWDEDIDHFLSNEQLRNALGETLYAQTINDKPLTILHISDTHGKHRELTDLPEADVIVHSGDFCFAGTENEAFDFINWFCDLPYKHKIFIAGNHDECLYGAEAIEGLDENCHYLCNSEVVIEGIKFYGIPFFLEDTLTDKHYKQITSIPKDTDVLITHNPPYGICDCSDGIHYGHEELRNAAIKNDCIELHLFGHIHDAIGADCVDGVEFHNGSCVDENYNLNNSALKVLDVIVSDKSL